MTSLQELLKVEIDFAQLNTITRRKKAALIQEEMELILKSDYFRIAFQANLEARDYKNNERSKWKDATPNEIYLHVMRAEEVLNPTSTNVVNIIVDDYYTFKKVIGMTYTSGSTIYTNTKYFDPRTSKMCGSNFFHEWGHKLGFKHDFARTSGRNNSICYIMNLTYEQCYNMLIEKSDERNKVLVCRRKFFFFKKCSWKSI